MFSTWDRRFTSIFMVTLLVEAVLVFFLAQQPIEQYTQKDIKRIQDRFARFVLQAEPVAGDNLLATETGLSGSEDAEAAEEVETGTAEEEPGESEGGTVEGESAGSISEPGGTGGRASSEAAYEARREVREAASRNVSSKGILGLITASDNGSGKDAVAGLVSQGAGGTGSDNLDDVLSSVSGLKTSAKPGSSGEGGTGGNGTGSGIRGGRKGKSATIDDLVSDMGTAGSSVMERKGDLVVQAPEQVKGRGRKSIYRSPAAIQEVLLGHSAAIRYCYERELKRNPTLKGKISVRITVGTDGSVKKAEIVSSTLNNRRVERCILSRIRLWKDFQPIREEEGDVTFRQIWSFGY